jgi:uncharacterized protein (TIGR03067 family)
LEGKWACASAILNGKPLPEEAVTRIRLTLTKDRYTTERGTQILFDSIYSVDPTRNPKQINIVAIEGEFKGKEGQGIYSARNGTLRICYTMPGRPRPTAFESKPGSETYFIIWKRLEP